MTINARQKRNSFILKAAIFATGFAGIVAEYVLSTLATYFIGNSVFQWTMIVSLMLFFMGVGSRLSRGISGNLISKFLWLEVGLSILVSFSSILVYTLASFTYYYEIVIYLLCMLVGLFIGLEIPIVVRINKDFESLKTNISSVLEKDYYGSLLGGVFFAFIGLPILGLTYTPFVLGFVNLGVAMLVAAMLYKNLSSKERKTVWSILSLTTIFLFLGLSFTKPIITWGEQKKYQDKVVYAEQTKYQKIVITEWKDKHWLYLNGNLQFSTMDEEMYHEPLVHPIMQLQQHPKNVLVLGGGDGCAVRELLKYKSISTIDMVDLDPGMTNLGKSHPILIQVNKGSMNSSKLTIYNRDAYSFLEREATSFYDAIIIDLPDPRSVELGRMYSQEFYNICYKRLRPEGMIITQSGSPYFATKAFMCIEKTMASAGFTTIPMHNQVLSMGEWGWMLGIKDKDVSRETIQQKIQSLDFKNVKTKWINQEATKLLTSFGKKDFFIRSEDEIEVNRIHNPVLYKYYLDGNWEIY